VSESELKTAFSSIADIARATIVRDKQGVSKGASLLHFSPPINHLTAVLLAPGYGFIDLLDVDGVCDVLDAPPPRFLDTATNIR
jgi:hypothetical protein